MEFMSSEESEDNEDGTSGPPPRHIEPLCWNHETVQGLTNVHFFYIADKMNSI